MNARITFLTYSISQKKTNHLVLVLYPSYNSLNLLVIYVVCNWLNLHSKKMTAKMGQRSRNGKNITVRIVFMYTQLSSLEKSRRIALSRQQMRPMV